MINSIATYKESLSRIANEVFDAADELEISQPSDRSEEDSPVSNSRMSRRSSRLSSPVPRSPIPNGIGTDPGSNDEEQLSKLREENGSLRRSLDAIEFVGHASRDETPKAISNNSKITVDRLPNRSQKNISPAHARSGGKNNSITKQEGFSNDGMQLFHLMLPHKRLQIQQRMRREQENASTINLKLQEERKLKESSQKELQDLKIEKDRTSNEMTELQKESREKITELRHLQIELSRRDIEDDPNESLEKLKSTISVLEKENTELKAEKNELEANLKLRLKSALESSLANDSEFVDRSASKLNEKLKEKLEHSSTERDKTLQELNRLKQHLLDKSN